MKGTSLDFTGANDNCLFVIQHQAAGDTRFSSLANFPDAATSWTIIASREWITDEGWVNWDGGDCPLEGGDVDVHLRSGRFIIRRGVRSIGGNWKHDGGRRDIVAYRPWPKPVYDVVDDTPIPF